MLLLAGWNLTQYSTFNKSDTYLCVCGVQFGGNVNEYFPSSSGRAAIFRTSGEIFSNLITINVQLCSFTIACYIHFLPPKNHSLIFCLQVTVKRFQCQGS